MDNSGICARSKDGSIKCCVNHYLKENSCVECPLGSFGWGCKTLCPVGSYGWLCSNQCNCPDHVCDYVKGCTTKNRTASTILPATTSRIPTGSRSDIQSTVGDSSTGVGLKFTMQPIFTSPTLSISNIIQSTSTILISTMTKTAGMKPDKPASDFAIFLVPIGIIIVILLIVIILLIAWKLNLLQRHNQILTSEVATLKKIPATDAESANYEEINTVSDRIGVKESYRNFHTISEPDVYQLSLSKYQEINVEEEKITEHSTMENKAEINTSAMYLLPTTSRSKHTYIDIVESSPEISETWKRNSDDSETVSVTEKYDDIISSRYNECISSENMYLHPI